MNKRKKSKIGTLDVWVDRGDYGVFVQKKKERTVEDIWLCDKLAKRLFMGLRRYDIRPFRITARRIK